MMPCGTALVQVLHLRGLYYSCIVELGNNTGTMCFGPLKNCFHTYLLVSPCPAKLSGKLCNPLCSSRR